MIEYGTLIEKDVLSLLELYKQLIPDDNELDEINANNIWKYIEKQNIKYFIAKENGKIIASCYICIIPNLTRGGKSIGFIENVITDIEYRGKGIGKNIIKNAIEYAKAQNCYKIILQSGKERTGAHKFYESLGFNGDSKRAFEMRL